jgi:hypothetical protein
MELEALEKVTLCLNHHNEEKKREETLLARSSMCERPLSLSSFFRCNQRKSARKRDSVAAKLLTS